MKTKPSNPTETAPAGSRAAECSAADLEICLHCDYWEISPRKIDTPGLGYCSLFDKLTVAGHGLQCTGWIKREPPNQKGQL